MDGSQRFIHTMGGQAYMWEIDYLVLLREFMSIHQVVKEISRASTVTTGIHVLFTSFS